MIGDEFYVLSKMRQLVSSTPNDSKLGCYIRIFFKKLDEERKINLENLVIEYRVNSFNLKYSKEHARCPKCNYSSTDVIITGFAIDLSNLKNYKNLNECTCIKCGEKHIVHDRICL